MPLSLSDAEELSPKNIQQLIVRKIDERDNEYIANEMFPLYQMPASRETYFRMDNLRAPMEPSSLAGESNIAGVEDLTEDEMSTTTLKEKISPEKGVDAELNTPQEILNLAEHIADSLRTDLHRSRSMIAWRSYAGEEGVIGADGVTPHSDIPSDHVKTGTDFSDNTVDVHSPLMEAASSIGTDGTALDQAGPITAAMSPEVLWDLMKNDDLEQRFSGVQVQNIGTAEELEQTIPTQVQIVRTVVPRTNGDGEPIDSNDTVVKAENAVPDNILDPYDPSAGSQSRNVVLGAFGRESAVMPWSPDRLSDKLDNLQPTGTWSVDASNGFILQGWAQNDPLISWRKIMQEIGFEMLRGENFAIMQGV